MSARDAVSSTHRHPLFARINPNVSRGAEQGGAAEDRRAPLAGPQARVIDVGAGHGLDFAHYPAGVTQVVAAKPEPHLRALAQAAAKHGPVSVEVKTDAAEALSAEDGEFDAAGRLGRAVLGVRPSGRAARDRPRPARTRCHDLLVARRGAATAHATHVRRSWRPVSRSTTRSGSRSNRARSR